LNSQRIVSNNFRYYSTPLLSGPSGITAGILKNDKKYEEERVKAEEIIGKHRELFEKKWAGQSYDEQDLIM
jgi:hypothetical protein